MDLKKRRQEKEREREKAKARDCLKVRKKKEELSRKKGESFYTAKSICRVQPEPGKNKRVDEGRKITKCGEQIQRVSYSEQFWCWRGKSRQKYRSNRVQPRKEKFFKTSTKLSKKIVRVLARDNWISCVVAVRWFCWVGELDQRTEKQAKRDF